MIFSRDRITTRTIGRLFLLLPLSICFLLSSAGWAAFLSSHTFEQWGNESLTQIEADFGRTDGLYNNSTTQTFPDYTWGQGVMLHANAAAASVDLSRLPRTQQQAQAIHDQYRCYLNGLWGYNAGANACGDRYYDDNAWLALAYIELYELTEDSTYLDWAREITTFCMSGENGPGDTPAGGIRWHESNTCGASVCATAPTCLANLRIYKATGIESYLTDGIRLYDWLRTSGVQASNGLYHQGIQCDGTVNYGYRVYQTAVPMQAAVLLYQLTGDTSYLSEAQRLAAAVQQQFINSTTHALGEIGYWGGHDMTNAYVELYAADQNTRWLNLAVGYLEYLHDHCKVGGRYPESWNETGGTASASLIANAAVARAYWKMAATIGGSATDSSCYLVKNRTSGLCLRPYNSNIADNTTVVLYNEQPTWQDEQWILQNLGNGYFNLRNVFANKSLQPYGNQTADNTNTVIYATHAAFYTQQWALTDLENGYFNILSRATGKSLHPRDSAAAVNTNVVIDPTDPADPSQQWQFVGGETPRSLMPFIALNGGPWHPIHQVIADAGDTVAMKADGPGAGTYRWEGPHGFTAAGNETTVTDIQPRQAGFYTVIHTSPGGTESYTAFQIRVPADVQLYQHCSYTGWTAGFGAGAYTAADIAAAGGLNNDASSLKIVPGYTVTFYDGDNLTGSSLVKTADDSCFVDDGWNDRITSLIIEGRPAPLAHWPFNDNSGLTAADASGHGYTAALTHMDPNSWTAGKHCGGLAFDGINDYIEIPGFKGVTGSAARTAAAWIRTTHPTGELLTWGANNTGSKWVIRINENGTLRAEVYGGNVYGTTHLPDNRWHHIAVVLEEDGSADNSEARLYVDGRPEPLAQAVDEPVHTAADYNVCIGVFLPGARYFQGILDEVRIYDRALSATQIRNLYQSHALSADTEPDGDVDFDDFAELARGWLDPAACDVDLTCDCTVDLDDLMFLAEEWLSQIAQ